MRTAESDKGGYFSGPPHTIWHAGPLSMTPHTESKEVEILKEQPFSTGIVRESS